MKKKKIAVIGLKGLPAFGGAATVGENIIEQLKDKYDFTVYAISSHTDLKTGNYNGYTNIIIRKIPFKKLNTFYYYIVSTIHAVLKGSYDLVHLHHRDAAFTVLILKLRFKVILTTHQFHYIREKWKQFRYYFSIQEKHFVKYADIITCVSKNEKRLIESKINQSPVYIPNGINVMNRSIKNISNLDSYLMFAACRIIPTKGCHVFFEALNKMNCQNSIYIAGDINQMLLYKKHLLFLSKNLKVNYLGLIREKKKLFNYIENANLFIFPSSMEAMSTMLLEAASLKTPIICSDIIENRDIFDNTEVLFFETDNSNDLAEKISWAFEHKDILKQKAENAYIKLEKKYLWKNIAYKYDELYQKLLIGNR